MICRDKFSNLYASYEMMGGHHIKAFFGMNARCTMNEVLKFPGFFDIDELNEYLGSIKIIPRPKNLGKTIRRNHNFYGDVYDTEKKYITPVLVPLQGIEDEIIYFFFEQHFDGHNNNPPYVKRKYKVQIGIIDVSVQKALEARETIIEFSTRIRNLPDPSELEALEGEMISIVSLAIKIQQKTGGIYQDAMDLNYNKDFNFIDQLVTEFRNDIKHMNKKIGFYARNVAFNNRASKPDYAGPNTYTVLEKEFGQVVNFNFESEYENLAQIRSLPNLPKISIDEIEEDQIEFRKTIQIKSKIFNDLPDFKTGYSKNTSFDLNQSLEKRAQNYNLVFADSADNVMNENIELISDSTNLPIYILLGHGNEAVTVPGFVLLSDVKEILLPDSNYLCRTTMVESENQYFILET